MSKTWHKVLIVGIGGQGVMTLTQILSKVARRQYQYISSSESRGLSQRGGSVASSICFSDKSCSAIWGQGHEKLILALDLLEGLRYAHLLARGGVMIVNSALEMPFHLRNSGNESLSREMIETQLRLQVLDPSKVVVSSFSPLTRETAHCQGMNFGGLGLLSNYLPFRIAWYREEISARYAGNIRETNLTAFDRARSRFICQQAKIASLIAAS